MVYVTADHGGWLAKQTLVKFLRGRGLPVTDLGPSKRLHNDDYPPLAARLGRVVRKTPGSFGIGICRSGVGMAMVANKIPGIRASQALTVSLARRARREENTNVLSLAADLQTLAEMKKIVMAWLQTSYRPIDRYRRRLHQVDRLDYGR